MVENRSAALTDEPQGLLFRVQVGVQVWLPRFQTLPDSAPKCEPHAIHLPITTHTGADGGF